MTDMKFNADKSSFRCGHVAIVGRPNVGKSTLLNRLIGQKLSITTRKPQTTRHHLLGIKNNSGSQIIYIDTPGIQQAPKFAINRYMNREIYNSIEDVDVIVLLIEAMKWTESEQFLLEKLERTQSTLIIGINKIDKITDKKLLLPFIEDLKQRYNFKTILPLSALSIEDIKHIESVVIEHLPNADAIYDNDQITTRNARFFAAEFIREKLTQKLGEELPYQLTVTIEKFKETERFIELNAIIWVERPGQKGIVIGKNGSILKSVGEQARKDIEQLLGQKVHLETWVKVKGKWTDDEKALKQFDFDL